MHASYVSLVYFLVFYISGFWIHTIHYSLKCYHLSNLILDGMSQSVDKPLSALFWYLWQNLSCCILTYAHARVSKWWMLCNILFLHYLHFLVINESHKYITHVHASYVLLLYLLVLYLYTLFTEMFTISQTHLSHCLHIVNIHACVSN